MLGESKEAVDISRWGKWFDFPRKSQDSGPAGPSPNLEPAPGGYPEEGKHLFPGPALGLRAPNWAGLEDLRASLRLVLPCRGHCSFSGPAAGGSTPYYQSTSSQ